jgi:hypothetical protein
VNLHATLHERVAQLLAGEGLLARKQALRGKTIIRITEGG